MNKEIRYQNTDVLLMDPCYSREYADDEDFELYCSDLVIETFADGYFFVIKGKYEEMKEKLDEIADNPERFSLGEFSLDTGRIGVYDYHKAIKEQPELEERIEKKEIVAAIIKNFTGTIAYMLDDEADVYVVGKSDDNQNDFFTIAFYE